MKIMPTYDAVESQEKPIEPLGFKHRSMAQLMGCNTLEKGCDGSVKE
jgi:hypothetical protein